MARYYIAQVSNARSGWTDIQDSASMQKKFSDGVAETFAQQTLKATRVIRKPHGWVPDGKYGITRADLERGGEGIALHEQARAARELKRSR